MMHYDPTDGDGFHNPASSAAKPSAGEQIAERAWAAFGKWCCEHDPDGDLSPFEQVVAYGKWCDAQMTALVTGEN